MEHQQHRRKEHCATSASSGASGQLEMQSVGNGVGAYLVWYKGWVVEVAADVRVFWIQEIGGVGFVFGEGGGIGGCSNEREGGVQAFVDGCLELDIARFEFVFG